MVPQKFSCSWSSLRSAEEISISETVTRNTDQSIANLEREVEVDTDTIGEQLSDLNAFFLDLYFLRPKQPLYRQCRDLLRRSCRDFSLSRRRRNNRSGKHCSSERPEG